MRVRRDPSLRFPFPVFCSSFKDSSCSGFLLSIRRGLVASILDGRSPTGSLARFLAAGQLREILRDLGPAVPLAGEHEDRVITRDGTHRLRQFRAVERSEERRAGKE